MASTPKDAEKAAVLTEKNQGIKGAEILNEAYGCTNAPIKEKEVTMKKPRAIKWKKNNNAELSYRMIAMPYHKRFSTIHQPASTDHFRS